MAKFRVEVEEILRKVVEVEAENSYDALNIVLEQYKNEEIILCADDYERNAFRVVDDNGKELVEAENF